MAPEDGHTIDAMIRAYREGLIEPILIGSKDVIGELLAEKLEQAGVDVRHKTFHGSTHEFFGMAAVVPDAAAAQTFAAHELKRAFGTAILPI